MTLADLARPQEDLVTAAPDTPVTELARLMQDETVGCVIIERNDEPIGIVTDRDIAVKIVGENRDIEGTTARDIMTEDPVTAEADAGLTETLESMRKAGVRRMPIVTDGKLVGIITLDDLVVLLEQEMHDISDVIKAESPPY